MKTIRLPIAFLVLVSVVMRPIEAQCPNWCNNNVRPWTTKCTWPDCSNCNDCGGSVPPTVSPVASPPANCPNWCNNNPQPWTTKCTWPECSQCNDCSGALPPTVSPVTPPPATCPNWCNNNPQPWTTKCTWPDCSQCNDCTAQPPTSAPTGTPTTQPTVAPAIQPTVSPTSQPTVAPTIQPTGSPTSQPTIAPAIQPTASPTSQPTIAPTGTPTESPTSQPTIAPAIQPTASPTSQPTIAPTGTPTATPTSQPTIAPTSPQPPTASPSGKPNILLILVDDVGTGDVPGYWGNTNTGVVDMPNVYDLVNKATLFTDMHSTPLCAPSRYLLLSGNYQHRGRSPGGTWSIGTTSQFTGTQKSIAEVLQAGGYHTGMMGKWHIGGLIPPAAGQTASTTDVLSNPSNDWTLPLVQGPQTLGFDSSLITDKGIQQDPYSFFRDGFLETVPADVRFWPVGTYSMPFGQSEILKSGEGDVAWDSSAYNMILLNETNRFLDDHFLTRPNDPFFAYVALGSAHLPHTPPDNYIDGEPVAGETPTAFLDLLKEMDLLVGSLIQTIEDRGLANDTIIIFSSDNGGLGNDVTGDSASFGHTTGGPLRESKGTIYEGGHRIPFMMRYDGVYPAGEERTHPLGLNDLFATLCDIAGISVPPGSAVDSVSFADYIINNNTAGLRQYLGVFRDKGQIPRARSIRFNNFKLIYDYINNVTSLYDLDADIGETTDLSSLAVHQSLIQTMEAELAAIRPV